MSNGQLGMPGPVHGQHAAFDTVRAGQGLRRVPELRRAAELRWEARPVVVGVGWGADA
jgi:hypothetical protein